MKLTSLVAHAWRIPGINHQENTTQDEIRRHRYIIPHVRFP